MPTRSKPFSGKKKKAQLQEKRKRKQQENENENNTKIDSDYEDDSETQELSDEEEHTHDTDSNDEEGNADELDQNREKSAKNNSSRRQLQKPQKDLRTVFEKESQVEIDKRKADSYTPLDIEKRDQVFRFLSSLTPLALEHPTRIHPNYTN